MQTSAVAEDDEVDIRPRFFDNLTNQWILVDTGAQTSCVPPSPEDTIDPNIRLEAVDGSILPCYGRKTLTFRIRRKTCKDPPKRDGKSWRLMKNLKMDAIIVLQSKSYT